MNNTTTEAMLNHLNYVFDCKSNGVSSSEIEIAWESTLRECASLLARWAALNNLSEERLEECQAMLDTGRLCGNGYSISVLPYFKGAFEVEKSEQNAERISGGRTM